MFAQYGEGQTVLFSSRNTTQATTLLHKKADDVFALSVVVGTSIPFYFYTKGNNLSRNIKKIIMCCHRLPLLNKFTLFHSCPQGFRCLTKVIINFSSIIEIFDLSIIKTTIENLFLFFLDE